MNDKMDLTAILQRLTQLEAQVAIRNCINRYMEICDALDADTELNELMDLFDEDSIWEGIGEKYAQSFGHFSSRQAIHDMFKGYTQKESHFVMNAHFVSSEQIYVEDTHAKATWLMLQTSTFRDGRSQSGHWKIKHFQTENIFSRPVSHWNSTAELPVPSQT
jgi:hypothetical protein